MAHPAFRWSRLLPITALLVITTGVAAAPIRQAWLPLIARPFGFNFGTMPAAGSPKLSASNAPSGGAVRRDNIELEAALTTAPDRLQMLAGSTSHTSESAGRRSEQTPDTSAGQAWGRNYRGGNRSGGGGGSLIGSGGGFGGSGGLLGSRAAPSAGPPVSYPRTTETRSNGNGLTRAPVPSNSGGSGGGGAVPGNNSGGGSGGGNGGGGAASGGNPGVGFAVGSGPIGGSATADGIFTGHTSGLTELGGNSPIGGTGSNLGGNGLSSPNLAANPEPSSILLFGTGLVAVAGAVRRRFRR